VAADDYVFQGFTSPTYTQVPDELFDELMPRLSESELKVLLYVVRRTFGFKKSADDISLKQMVEGIRTRDGRQLDNGTGPLPSGCDEGCPWTRGQGRPQRNAELLGRARRRAHHLPSPHGRRAPRNGVARGE
jgi:hypothetical protein